MRKKWIYCLGAYLLLTQMFLSDILPCYAAQIGAIGRFDCGNAADYVRQHFSRNSGCSKRRDLCFYCVGIRGRRFQRSGGVERLRSDKPEYLY